MSHPYTTRARTEFAINDGSRMQSLLDENQTGGEFAGRYSDLIERAANMVDADLASRYIVPFAAVTDLPPCHGIVSDMTDYAALSMLFPAGSEESKAFLEMYRGLVLRIIRRESSVPGATEVGADDSAAPVAISASYAEPTFAGVNSAGARRTRGMF